MKLHELCEEMKYRNIYNFVMDNSNDYFFGIDMEYIGEGASRRVYRYKDMAIKIAKNRFGLMQNGAEVEVFNKCKKTEIINIVCPILWHDEEYKVVISKYAEPYYKAKYGNEGWKNIYDYVTDYNKRESLSRLLYKYRKLIGISDSTAINDTEKESAWGELNGKPVLVDYGYTDHVANTYSGNRAGDFSFHKLTERDLCRKLEKRIQNNFKSEKQIEEAERVKAKEREMQRFNKFMSELLAFAR